MITRFGHMAIRARDIEATAKFYREVLGMKEAFRMQNPAGNAVGTIYMYVAPSQFIEIFPNGVEEHRGDSQKEIGLNHFCFEVDDAAACLEKVRKAGAPIDSELKRGYSRCIMFWTHDPDGNRIEIMQLTPESLQAEANKRIAAEA